MLEAVFGVEVGLPEEVEVEAELVGDYKSKSLGPSQLTGSGRDSVLAAVSQRFTFPSAAPSSTARSTGLPCLPTNPLLLAIQ